MSGQHKVVSVVSQTAIGQEPGYNVIQPLFDRFGGAAVTQ
jgi:hypothetical protein